MPGVVGGYITRLFLGRALAVLLGLAALLQILDLLDKAGDVLARGGVADIGTYALLRFPSTIGRLIPLAVLVGAILAFRRLAGTLEITALRAVGTGTGRLLWAMAPACALAGAVQLGLMLGVAPRTERALADWWDRHEAADRPIALARRLWLRDGTDIVAADAVSRNGGVLEGVLIVRREAEGRALVRIEAGRAVHGPDGWRLEGVRVVRPGDARAAAPAEFLWAEGPPPRVMRDLARPIEAGALGTLLAGWRGEGPVVRGPAHYATRLHAIAASAVGPFVMLLLAVPAAFGLPRQDGGTRRSAVGLVLGLGYLVAGGLANAVGEAGGIGPVAAAWIAPVVFTVAGLICLSYEDG